MTACGARQTGHLHTYRDNRRSACISLREADRLSWRCPRQPIACQISTPAAKIATPSRKRGGSNSSQCSSAIRRRIEWSQQRSGSRRCYRRTASLATAETPCQVPTPNEFSGWHAGGTYFQPRSCQIANNWASPGVGKNSGKQWWRYANVLAEPNPQGFITGRRELAPAPLTPHQINHCNKTTCGTSFCRILQAETKPCDRI